MGIDESFVRLIGPMELRMFQTVWRILRHSQDAEDALQCALTTAWQQRALIAEHRAPQALILKICADAAIDQFRRRRRRPECDVAGLEDCLASARPPPVDDAIANEILEVVMEAISRLSQNQATAVVMRFIQGESLGAIAAALGCRTETVREHLDRGRERLGQMLGRLAPRDGIPTGTAKPDLCPEIEQ